MIGGSDLKRGARTQKQVLNSPKDPKRGTKWRGQQKKESETLDNMGQSGGAGRTERRTEWCRCAGDQTKKYKRPDRPKRVETWDSAGACGTACLGRAKQEKFLEVRHSSHTQQGRDRELYSILHLVGEVLHCRTPQSPSRPQPKKRT
jgi:hypothetical protein